MLVNWRISLHLVLQNKIFSPAAILLCLSLCCFPFLCNSRDEITVETQLRDPETLVSAGRRFELGFFTPNGAQDTGRYLGIWYKSDRGIVVWVANRYKPVTGSSSSGALAIRDDGSIHVLDERNKSYWSSGPPSATCLSSAAGTWKLRLNDSGNLFLAKEGGDAICWQSFDHPTDTFLPGMKMANGINLTSWKNQTNPSPGDFTFQLDKGAEEEFEILNQTVPYWQSEVAEALVPEGRDRYYYIRSLLYQSHKKSGYPALNFPTPARRYNYDARLVMNSSGRIEVFGDISTTPLSWEPRDFCSLVTACGNFASCNSGNQFPCKCLHGYGPVSPDSWESRNFQEGCDSQGHMCDRGENVTAFFKLNMVRAKKSTEISASDEGACRQMCLAQCSCRAYSFTAGLRSEASCWIWTDELKIVEDMHDDGGLDINLRVPRSDIGGQVSSASPNPSERSSVNRRSLYPIFIGIIAAILFLLSAAMLYLYHSRRKWEISRRESLESNHRSVMFRSYDCERLAKDIIDSGLFSEDDKKEIDVPFIGLDLILAATDNFCDTNKLGQGGFGPVYKGNLPGGQIIAIKRLSSLSGQGFQEFKNEVVLIAKLQHRNLVRLLGYCVDGNERILVYEFMPNKSLDFYIFDRTRCLLLNWETRLDIIMGIARGLLYLHHDSRLRIIHRDLKTSNVLLDDEMNPKISDFGLARIFGGKQIEASTERIVGTHGYMSPEYALEGFFSIKSDVFSFGVVLLEILSGKRNTAFHMSEQGFSLVGYAWKLWEEDKTLDLMDQAMRETCKAGEFVRCVNVGLLCVQEDPADRPAMASVLFMLGGEAVTLPSPKRPVLAMRRSLSSTLTSSSKVEETTE